MCFRPAKATVEDGAAIMCPKCGQVIEFQEELPMRCPFCDAELASFVAPGVSQSPGDSPSSRVPGAPGVPGMLGASDPLEDLGLSPAPRPVEGAEASRKPKAPAPPEKKSEE